jgi:excisionase family DNA binding protein
MHPMTRTTHTSRLGLTTSEAARHLGVSLSTVRRWSDMGYLRGYRTPGGQRRFPVEELDDFVASLDGAGGRTRFAREAG